MDKIDNLSLSRQEIIDEYIRKGKENFAKNSNTKEFMVYEWLYLQNDIKFNLSELRNIVENILIHTNNVFPVNFGLTVGNLKKQLKNLPDNTPVFYQKMDGEDLNVEKFVWESLKINEKRKNILQQNSYEYMDVIEIDGNFYERNYSDYIHAFSACPRINDDGQKVFLINGHY